MSNNTNERVSARQVEQIEYLRQRVAGEERLLMERIERDAEYRAKWGDAEADRILRVYRKRIKAAQTWLVKAEGGAT